MKFTTMEQGTSDSVAAPRFRTFLFALFAALAVCLAMAGVYGVMTYAVSQRSNEIGLRIALGAGKASVLGLILRQGLMVIAGIALGLGIAVAGTHLLNPAVSGEAERSVCIRRCDHPFVSRDPHRLLCPARRAADTDPITALRHE